MARKSGRAALMLEPDQRKMLEGLAASRTSPVREVERAKVLLGYAAGTSITQLQRQLGLSRPMIYRCVDKALAAGVQAGLKDKYHRPHAPEITDEAKAWVVSIACTKPKEHGLACELWSIAALARFVSERAEAAGFARLSGAGKSTIWRILDEHDIKPHKIRYYLEKRDPDFDRKMQEVLMESPLAVSRAYAIASHPRVASISFGLMDFVSSHAGAIPSEAMQVDGQFSHPLVVQAKLQIASACHAYGKTPSHCVVTEFKDDQAIARAATQAARQFGYPRMWSIHPSQVRPILAAFSPDESAVQQAAEIIEAGYIVDWAPINHNNRLHDRASYRFYWHVLERAHATGKALPSGVQALFSGQGAAPQPPHTPW